MSTTRLVIIGIVVIFLAFLCGIGIAISNNISKVANHAETSSTAAAMSTTEQSINTIIDGSLIFSDNTQVTYDDKSGVVNITIDSTQPTDYSYLSDTFIKADAFSALKAVWTRNIVSLNVSNVYFIGKTQDKYGNTCNNCSIASVKLTKDTASKFNWNNLDQNTAWTDYDSTWLLPGA